MQQNILQSIPRKSELRTIPSWDTTWLAKDKHWLQMNECLTFSRAIKGTLVIRFTTRYAECRIISTVNSIILYLVHLINHLIDNLALRPFWFCNHLDWKQRAGYFTLTLILMSCDCKCSVALPYGASNWPAVCNHGSSWSYSLAFSGGISLILSLRIFNWPFEGCASFVINFHVSPYFTVMSVACRFVITWLEKVSCWLSCMCCLLLLLSLSHIVYRVSRDTWLYRFLKLAFFFTFIILITVIYWLRYAKLQIRFIFTFVLKGIWEHEKPSRRAKGRTVNIEDHCLNTDCVTER